MDTKVLFIHNSYTWYRAPLFNELSKLINVKYLFTKIKASQKSYAGIGGNEFSKADAINYEITNNFLGISWYSIKSVMFDKYDIVLVTVLDTWDQIFEAFVCAIIAKIRGKKVAYFWECWDYRKALKNKRNLGAKEGLKNIIRCNRILKAKLFLKLLSNFVDSYVAAGRKAKDLFLECGIDSKKIVTAFDSSEIELTTQENINENIPTNMKIILYFGRVQKWKGPDILIKAFSKLEKKNKDVLLMFCGDGDYLDYCKKLSEKLGIKNIVFKGFIQPNQRMAYYSIGDIFVLPDVGSEPWGLSVNEAMQFGNAVIATTLTGSAYDLIQENGNGYIVEPGSVNSLYNALLELTLDDEKLDSFKKKSNEIIRRFTYENMAQGFKKAFQLPLKNQY